MAHRVHRLNPIVALIALLLAMAWLPMTSHELLESTGWIHQGGFHGNEVPGHDVADGTYQAHTQGLQLRAPSFFVLIWIAPPVALSLAVLVAILVVTPQVRQITESPPGLGRRWRFVLRQALPSRAPSFAR